MGASSGAKLDLAIVHQAGLALILTAFVFSIFVNLLMLTGPLFMLQVYDRVLSSRSQETLLALTLLVACLYALMGALDFARGRVLARYGARFQAALDPAVFRAVMRPSTASHSSRLTATRDLEAVQSVYSSPAATSVMDAPFSPLFILVIFLFHPILGWVALAGGALLVAIAFTNQFTTRDRIKEAQVAAEGASAFLEHSKRAGEIVRSQGMLDPVTRRWQDQRNRALSSGMQVADRTGTFGAASRSIRFFMQSGILAVGAWLVLQGQITAGAMIAASILFGRALAPVEQLLARWPQIQRARQGARSLAELLEADQAQKVDTLLPRPEARLEVRNLSILHPEDRHPILRAIAFDLAPGQALGVIGRSGSGKTTLARAIVGLQPPASGDIRLGGALLQQYAPDDLGRHIGYLPQDAMLIDGTIAENIARMSLEPDSDKVVAAARAAKAHGLITGLRQGYDTPVNADKLPLSGGQRQRIALARALYADPVLLVLDEPNSALDAEGSEALNAAVRGMKSEGRSVVIMTHRPTAISECDTLLVLDAGRVTAHGPRDEVLRSMVKNASDIQKTMARQEAT